MKIVKLSNKFYDLCKIAGKYSAQDVEKEIKINKNHEYDSYLDLLYSLYKLHDDLYDILYNISANKKDDKFLSVVEELKEYLPIIINKSKTIPNFSDRVEEDSKGILEVADKLYKMYFGIFPTETRNRSLENFTYLASLNLQYNLHALLDRLFDQVILLLG